MPLKYIDDVVCPLAQTLKAGNWYALGEEWFALAALALFVSTMLLIFFYLIATALRNQSMLTFIKLELFEVLSSLLILVFIGGIVGLACAVKVGALFPDSVNAEKTMYAATMNYFDKVATKFEAWMELNYILNVQIDQMASVTPHARPLGVGLVATPLVGFALPIKSFLRHVFGALAMGYIINEAYRYVFEFVAYGFLKYYLPIGLFLRCFTPTRRIGGTLIALSLSLSLLFPFIMTFTVEAMLGEDQNGRPYGIMAGIDNVIGDYWHSKKMSSVEKEVDPVTGEEKYESPILKFFSRFTLPDLATLLAGGLLSMIGDWISQAVGAIFGTIILVPLATVSMAFMLGYLMPAINVLILVQTTRFFSRYLGEEIDITALTRMI